MDQFKRQLPSVQGNRVRRYDRGASGGQPLAFASLSIRGLLEWPVPIRLTPIPTRSRDGAHGGGGSGCSWFRSSRSWSHGTPDCQIHSRSLANDPSLLLGILVYGYATGVFSSRKLERATYDSVAFRFVAANEHPDHDTIAVFRRCFLTEIEGLFVQVDQDAIAKSP